MSLRWPDTQMGFLSIKPVSQKNIFFKQKEEWLPKGTQPFALFLNKFNWFKAVGCTEKAQLTRDVDTCWKVTPRALDHMAWPVQWWTEHQPHPGRPSATQGSSASRIQQMSRCSSNPVWLKLKLLFLTSLAGLASSRGGWECTTWR